MGSLSAKTHSSHHGGGCECANCLQYQNAQSPKAHKRSYLPNFLLNNFLIPSPQCTHMNVNKWPNRKYSQLTLFNKVLKVLYPINNVISKFGNQRPEMKLNNEEKMQHHQKMDIQEPKKKKNYTILYFHGNGENVCCFEKLLYQISHNFCCDVHAYEYPQYGWRKKEPFEVATVLKQAEQIYYHLCDEYSKVIVIGRSLGTGVATHLAMSCKISAVCLISPYKSFKQIVNSTFFGRGGECLTKYVNFEFDSFGQISRNQHNVFNPILFLHGKNDTLIRPSNSHELHQMYIENLRKSNNNSNLAQIRIINADHNNIIDHKDLFPVIKQFLQIIKFEFQSGEFDITEFAQFKKQSFEQ